MQGTIIKYYLLMERKFGIFRMFNERRSEFKVGIILPYKHYLLGKTIIDNRSRRV